VSASKEKLNESARTITGVANLIGTKGATDRDQLNIDRTIARSCGATVLTRSECARHGRESRQ
jgi:hypothetical protein